MFVLSFPILPLGSVSPWLQADLTSRVTRVGCACTSVSGWAESAGVSRPQARCTLAKRPSFHIRMAKLLAVQQLALSLPCFVVITTLARVQHQATPLWPKRLYTVLDILLAAALTVGPWGQQEAQPLGRTLVFVTFAHLTAVAWLRSRWQKTGSCFGKQNKWWMMVGRLR